MSLHRAATLTRPILRRCFTTSLVRSALVRSRPTNRFRPLSTKTAEDGGGLAGKLEAISCVLRGSFRYFSVWTILRKLGIPYCMIIQFRRKFKKIYYVTGLSTIVRAAFPIIVGDILAQTLYPIIFEKRHKSRKASSEVNKSLEDVKKGASEFKRNVKEINWCRTSHFAVIGGFLVGPFGKRWNLFWGRRIRRYPPGAYLSRILILDALLLTPAIVATYMAGYDWLYLKNLVKKEGKDIKAIGQKLRKRYETPFTDMCLFYITTKPLVALAACYVLPGWMRGSVRKLYSFLFYCFISHTITHFKLGEEITNRKKKRGKKGTHYDSGGGIVCMAMDKIHDAFEREKKSK